MACECGWNKDFIVDNLTAEQIKRYCKIIQEQRLRELQLNTIATLKAVACAFGSIKKDDFVKFLDSLCRKEQDIEETLQDMKKAGLPVEEK